MSVRAFKWAVGLGHVDLTPMQRSVLFVLCYHHNHSTGLCCPSMETIAQEAGTAERVARTAIRGLEHVGLVRAQKRTNERGQTSNQYLLFGKVKNKSGRSLRSGTGRNHTTARSGGSLGSGEREDNKLLGEITAPSPLKIVGGRDA